MTKGRVTVPTDKGFVEGTKEIMKRWGADAVRDCDGTELPDHPKELAEKVYKTYFVVRGNNAFAYAHDELNQNTALISEFCLATEEKLAIDPLAEYFSEQFVLNEEDSSLSRWQVIDRTENREVEKWEYDKEKKVVVIPSAKIGHEYTVSFFARSLWNPTQIYNYISNGWTIDKDRDIDPVFPEAEELMEDDLKKWLENNPEISVVRFTTFFYHFFIAHSKTGGGKVFDWFGYAMTASPKMFELFETATGEKIKIEDVVDGGYYANHFRSPSPIYRKYLDFVSEFVAKTAKRFVDITHEYGREAMMFLGDNWIGTEPFGKYFPLIGLDAVVGSVQSGATIRMLSEIPSVKYHEARFMPYFFPDGLPNDDAATKRLVNSWVIERRAMMRKPVDRIGFGGYLSLAATFPKFVSAIENLCNEFRDIYDAVDGKEPYCLSKVAILSEWGKIRSWMVQMVSQDAPYQKITSYQGVLEALSGLPFEVDFIDFDDVKADKLSDYDVVFNYGENGTAFVGGEIWKDAEVVSALRKYVLGGGGLIGMGEPTACDYGGRYFQLASAFGVERERGYSMVTEKIVPEKKAHFITEDVTGEIDYGNPLNDVYAFENTTVLDVEADKYIGMWPGHVRMAANDYGKGRCFYMTGMRYDHQTSRILHRAILWCAHKEDTLKKAYSSNMYTECHYYPSSKKYAIVNNTDLTQKTFFYDIDGKGKELTLSPSEIVWIKE